MEQIKCEKLEKGSTKKQKDSKLYLEFLKCYWKKDYQQLAQKY